METEIAFYAVRDLIPGFLDVAGMPAEADAMRGMDVCDRESVGRAIAVVQEVRDGASGRWAPFVEEVCFWAEALIWASWASDTETLKECRKALGRAIDEGYHLMTAH